jgi:hypothetical protein
LLLTVYPGRRGGFTLYDDHGIGFGYRHGQDTFTPITHTQRGRKSTVTIDAATGRFPGELRARSWELELLNVTRPREVTLESGHRTRRVSEHGALRSWAYDRTSHTLTINTGALATNAAATISAQP